MAKNARLKNPNVTPQGLFDTAIGFLEAARRCEEPLPIANTQPPQMIAPVVPTITSYAFACEVLLKAHILSETGMLVDGHSLEELYNQLASQTQKSILEIYEYTTATPRSILIAELPRFSRAFVDWRYVYEKIGGMDINLHVLKAFSKALSKVLMSSQAKVTTSPALAGLTGLG